MHSPYNFANVFLALVFSATALLQTAAAGDWPQLLGPQRNGVAPGEELATRWPADGPKQLWTAPLGSGFSSPVVGGGKLIVFHRTGSNERVQALNPATGERLWKTDFPATYRATVSPDAGPRCSPVIHDGKVYLFGAAGDLHCVALADGGRVWSRDVYGDYNGDEGYFGAGSTPLVAGGKLLVNVGGRDAGIVAFDLKTGKTLWKATKEIASYSAPVLANLGGRTMAIFLTRLNVVAVDPANGAAKVLAQFGRQGPTVNAATPLVFGRNIFVTASYGIGAKLLETPASGDLSKTRTVWASDIISSQFATPVYKDGYIYGCDGRQDGGGVCQYRCIDAQTGKQKWSIDNVPVTHTILSGDKLLLVDTDGGLKLAKATPTGYEKIANANLLPEGSEALAPPALSGGRLYVRSSQGARGTLHCFAVGK